MKKTRALETSAKAKDGVFLCKRTNAIEKANNTVRQQSLKPNKVARSCAPLGKVAHLMIH